MWVRIPLETYIFILNFSLPPRSEQVNGAVANEIKHVHSPEVIVVLDPRYDLSYKALYIRTCSIALIADCSVLTVASDDERTVIVRGQLPLTTHATSTVSSEAIVSIKEARSEPYTVFEVCLMK